MGGCGVGDGKATAELGMAWDSTNRRSSLYMTFVPPTGADFWSGPWADESRLKWDGNE